MSSKNQITQKERAAATDVAGNALFQEKQIFFEGAIPHPEILRGYADINESFPERIIAIAENHAKTEDESQQSLVKGNIASVILGQILSFIFGALGIGATVYLGINGQVAGAVASSVAVIVQSVVAAMVNRKEK